MGRRRHASCAAGTLGGAPCHEASEGCRNGAAAPCELRHWGLWPSLDVFSLCSFWFRVWFFAT
eukprot:6133016-Pyramimonas_sp.AAC.1